MHRFPSARRLAPLLGLAALTLEQPAPLRAQVAAEWVEARASDWFAGARRSAPGEWGIAVADERGRLLWSVNAEQPLMPASTVKVFTTGFARSVLGGNARRPTRVVGAGRLDPNTGEWVGSWALELNGDFTLERAGGPGPTLYDLARRLADAGVRHLNGPLQIQSGDGPADAVYPAVWSPRHAGRLFAPPVGALTLHENVVWMTVEPGERVGGRAVLRGTSPQGLAPMVKVTATTGPGRRSRIYLRAARDGGWVVTGRIGVRAGARRLAAVAAEPRVVLNAAWAAALQRAGITWSPVATTAAAAPTQVLAEVSSLPLDSLASEINRRSHNLGAELLLRWAGGREGAADRLAAHVRQVVGTGTAAGVHLVDGSGLSYDNRASPVAFTTYLARFPELPGGHNFPQLLPANGAGTLRGLRRGFPGVGVVRAKTGTLGRVSTVVGYLGRPEGVLLVAVMYNGPRPWAARQAQWRLFRVLGANGVVIPADSAPVPPVQLGGEETARPNWLPQLPADSAGQ